MLLLKLCLVNLVVNQQMEKFEFFSHFLFVDLNLPDAFGVTPLHLAAKCLALDIVEALLSKSRGVFVVKNFSVIFFL